MSAYRTEPRVRASYELTVDDLLGAETPFLRRERRRSSFVLLATALAIIGYLLARGMTVAAVVFGGLVALAGHRFASRRASRRMAQRQIERTREECRQSRVEASDDGIVLADGLSRTERVWSHLTCWFELDDTFVIFTTPGSSSVVPKRAFDDADALASFRQLLDAHAPRDESAVSRAAWVTTRAGLAYVAGFLVFLGATVEAVAHLVR